MNKDQDACILHNATEMRLNSLEKQMESGSKRFKSLESRLDTLNASMVEALTIGRFIVATIKAIGGTIMAAGAAFAGWAGYFSGS